jgi:hypothetical protein
MNRFSRWKSMKGDAVSLPNQDGSQACMLNARILDGLTPVHGKDAWIAFQRVSLAKIFHVLDQVQEFTESEAGLFGSYSKQLTLLNHQSFSLKTPRESERKAGAKLSGPLWREDIPGETERLKPLMSARATKEIAGGALLPTLTVCGNWNRKGASQNSGDGLATALRKMPTLLASDGDHGGPNARDSKGRYSLSGVIPRLPTLLKSDGSRGPTKAERPDSGGPNLHTALRRLPTQLLPQEISRGAATGFRLTPEFSEWWMGWPIRWTALKPVETGKSRSKRS